MNNPTIQLVITGQETEALLQLLDAAVKHGGLNFATNAAYFLKRIQDAQKAPPLDRDVRVLNDPATSPG